MVARGNQNPTVRANALKNNAPDGADGRAANLLPQSGPEKKRMARPGASDDWMTT
jgi:hypothetical protein